MNMTPRSGLLRLRQIVGDPKADPPIPPIIPVAASTWWAGVRAGKFPQPIKLGPGITAWPIQEVLALTERPRPDGQEDA
jgi:prophage regulatory protein